MKRTLFFFLFTAMMLSVPALFKYGTQGFRLAKLDIVFPFHSEWEVPFDEALRPLLNQRFTYLGKGSQCYVFASEDGKIVIKFFRLRGTPDAQKITSLFDACKIAYEHLQKETALLYLHLNRTSLNLPVLRCIAPLGRTVQIDLNRTRFALQRRAQNFEEALLEARFAPNLMRKRIDALLSLLKTRAEKGVFNTDPSLSRNFGFLEDRAVEIDFGNYQYSPDLKLPDQISHYQNKLRSWLQTHAPEWVFYLDENQ